MGRRLPIWTGLLLLPALAWAASPRERTLAERTRAADRVVLAKVASSRFDAPGGDPRKLMTITALTVLRDLKGKGPHAVELVQVGGWLGKWHRWVAGDAHLVPGESAVLFLRCRDPHHPALCSLVGLARGKLAVHQGRRGREVLLPGDHGPPVRAPLARLVAQVHAASHGGGR